MKNIFKNWGVKKGSALLIALLMMGVLMTLTLGISTLVLREIRVTQSIVDANKAYYAAEAGVERSLYELSKSLPGVEPKGDYTVAVSSAGSGAGVWLSESVDEFLQKYNPGFAFKYQTSNRADSVPSFPDKQPIFMEKVASNAGDSTIDCQLSTARSPFAFAFTKEKVYQDCGRVTYRKLGLNETHIIPLFSAVKGEDVLNVNDFLVQYYLNIKDGSALYGEFAGMKLESFDVLRWKIYGKPLQDDGVQRTESIADFYPGVTNNSAKTPVCIGTDSTIQTSGKENCIFPSLSKRPPKIDEKDIDSLNDVTLWSAARECYQTDAGVGVTGGALIKGTTQDGGTGCQMRDFIDNHKENYLILTNMVNPNIAGIANLKDPSQVARADIYYRVLARPAAPGEAPDSVPKLVKDFAEIKSEGSSANGQVVKTLDVRYKAPGFLPVFNFSLYKTKESENSDKVK
jgi:hypothetical protein